MINSRNVYFYFFFKSHCDDFIITSTSFLYMYAYYKKIIPSFSIKINIHKYTTIYSKYFWFNYLDSANFALKKHSSLQLYSFFYLHKSNVFYFLDYAAIFNILNKIYSGFYYFGLALEPFDILATDMFKDEVIAFNNFFFFNSYKDISLENTYSCVNNMLYYIEGLLYKNIDIVLILNPHVDRKFLRLLSDYNFNIIGFCNDAAYYYCYDLLLPYGIFSNGLVLFFFNFFFKAYMDGIGDNTLHICTDNFNFLLDFFYIFIL